jgi:prepilin peptidase CpaA
MSLNHLILLTFIELLIVAWIEFKTEKISNMWALLNLILALILYTNFRSLYPMSWEILLFPLGSICLGFILYLFNIMGAGDSKYLGSLFLIIPLEYQFLFFEKLVASTILTGGILFFIRLFKQRHELKVFFFTRYLEGIKDAIKSRFSYAPVVTLAWLLLGLKLWR